MGSDDGKKPNHAQEGLPKVTASRNYALPFIFVFVIGAIGLAIAYAIFTNGDTAKYEARIKEVVRSEHHWAFAAAAVLGATIRLVNFYPAVHKQMIMLRNSGNLRSNPFIYKAIGAGASMKHVVFDDDGEVGKYNRANRSLHHMIENFGSVLAGLFLASTVFPYPVFVCVCVFCVGRVAHQVGYTTGAPLSSPRPPLSLPVSLGPRPVGYGGHGIGFALSALASAAIEGMLGFVAIKAFS